MGISPNKRHKGLCRSEDGGQKTNLIRVLFINSSKDEVMLNSGIYTL